MPYVYRSTFCPHLGKGMELRQVLAEEVKSSGSTAALLRQVVGEGGPGVYTIAWRFQDLGEYESWMHGRLASPAFRDFVAASAPLCRAVNTEILEVMVPFSS